MSKIIRQSRNMGGSFYLIRLPLGMGLNIGKGFSGFAALRSYEWAAYDHADHKGYGTRWAEQRLSQDPTASHPFAVWFDEWDERRFWQRMARKVSK